MMFGIGGQISAWGSPSGPLLASKRRTGIGASCSLPTHPSEGRLTEPTVATQAWRRELVFMPLLRPSHRLADRPPGPILQQNPSQQRADSDISCLAELSKVAAYGGSP